MSRRTTLRLIRFGNGASPYFELTNVVLKDAGRNRYHTGPIVRCGAGTRLNVSQVGRCVGLRPQAKKENVYATEGIELLEVKLQCSFQIGGVGLHRREALHLSEECLAKESFKVPNKAETVIHSHGREGILSKQVKSIKKIVSLIRLRQLSQNPVQGL